MNYKKHNKLDWYDECSALDDFIPAKSDETQTVIYEDFRIASRQPFVGPVFDDDGEEISIVDDKGGGRTRTRRRTRHGKN